MLLWNMSDWQRAVALNAANAHLMQYEPITLIEIQMGLKSSPVAVEARLRKGWFSKILIQNVQPIKFQDISDPHS